MSQSQQPTETPAPPPAAIEYAPARPPRRRWRWSAATVLLLALAVAGWHCGPGLWRRALAWHTVRQCRAFALPPDTVVYDNDPASMVRLSGSRGYAKVNGGRRGTQVAPRGPAVLRSDPPCLNPLPAVLRRPQMMSPVNGGPWGAEPLLFLHERKSPGGKRRLVVLRGSIGPSSGTAAPRIDVNYAYVLVESHGWDLPDINEAGAISGKLVVPPEAPAATQPTQPTARFLAGQPDPADESLIHLSYELNGVRREVTARLNDHPRGPRLVFKGVE